MNKKLIILVLFSAIFLHLRGQRTIGVGAHLKHGVSAKAVGMGSAYTALSEDPSALYWNPAGLLGTKGAQLQMDIRDQMGPTDFHSFSGNNTFQMAFSHSLRKKLFRRFKIAWGLFISHYSVSDIHEYDAESNYKSDFDFYETFGLTSIAIKYRVLDLGLSWKYINQNFTLVKSGTHNNSKTIIRRPHDIGIKIHPFPFLTIGLMIRDSLKVGQFDSYPRSVHSGVAVRTGQLPTTIPMVDFTFSLDLVSPHKQDKKLNMGIEMKAKDKRFSIFALRYGRSNILISSYQHNKLDEINHYSQANTVGVGLRIKKYIIDYAFRSSDQKLLNNNFLTITVTI